MVTNNEAVENFLTGKRNLAAFQFSQLIQETTTAAAPTKSLSSGDPSMASSRHHGSGANQVEDVEKTLSNLSLAATTTISSSNQEEMASKSKNLNSDEIAFNYAMVNLFTGCPQRASIIFSDLVKRYPRNPRLWLRLAESMLAAERSKMTEYEHIQQLAYPHSRDHLIKTKNKPLLIKINPNYCKQHLQQRLQTQHGTPPNFLVIIKGYLQKSLDLINEYNDISSLTDDVPTVNNSSESFNNIRSISQQQQSTSHSLLLGGPQTSSNTSASSQSHQNTTSMIPTSTSPSLFDSHLRSTPTVSTDLSQQLSYADPYRSIKRSALYHLKNKVQLNLAYISLCMGEPGKALTYTTQCLKSSPQGYEKILASLYHAEACILASRIDEAIQFLNIEILNMAKNLSQDQLMSNTGADDTSRIVFGDDLQNQFDGGSLATVVTYNLSVAYAARGEFENAQKILVQCIHPTKPNPMQLIICSLYVQLQLGQLESAKKTISSNLPQFR